VLQVQIKIHKQPTNKRDVHGEKSSVFLSHHARRRLPVPIAPRLFTVDTESVSAGVRVRPLVSATQEADASPSSPSLREQLCVAYCPGS